MAEESNKNQAVEDVAEISKAPKEKSKKVVTPTKSKPKVTEKKPAKAAVAKTKDSTKSAESKEKKADKKPSEKASAKKESVASKSKASMKSADSSKAEKDKDSVNADKGKKEKTDTTKPKAKAKPKAKPKVKVSRKKLIEDLLETWEKKHKGELEEPEDEKPEVEEEVSEVAKKADEKTVEKPKEKRKFSFFGLFKKKSVQDEVEKEPEIEEEDDAPLSRRQERMQKAQEEQLAKDEEDKKDTSFIADGMIDSQKYDAEPYKVLFVFKEPSSTNAEHCGRDAKDLTSISAIYRKFVLHDTSLDLPEVSGKVAVLNLSKMEKPLSASDFTKYLQDYKKQIQSQIEILAPDLIIVSGKDLMATIAKNVYGQAGFNERVGLLGERPAFDTYNLSRPNVKDIEKQMKAVRRLLG